MLKSIYDSIFAPSFSQDLVPHKTSPAQYTTAGNHKIGFDDICAIVKRGKTASKGVLLINTLSVDNQENLIFTTIPIQSEETLLNGILTNHTMSQYTIIVYGRNSADDSVDKKFKQLHQLGFTNVFIYYGGMFEWLLLQDIYGSVYFPTTKSQENDPLKYMAKRKLDF